MSPVTAATRPLTGDARIRSFVLWAFGFSWTLWIPAGLAARGTIEVALPTTLLIIIGSFGPMIAAIVVAFRSGGSAAVRDLFRRLRFRSMPRRWYGLALVLGAVTTVPAIVYVLIGGDVDGGVVAGHLAVLPLHFLIVATVGGGLDEEFGWRGLGQPLLQQHLSPVAANVVLGVIWAAWHLPLWLDPTSPQAAYPFALYTVVIVGHSLVTGYVYNSTGGSILAAILVHSANNAFDGLRYAVLGDAGDDLVWQLTLAAASLGLGVTLAVRNGGRLGLHRNTDVPTQPTRTVRITATG